MATDFQNQQTKPTILLVEDDMDALKMLARLLRSKGHIVHTAEGYQDALEISRRERIDLAICDIGLWDGDGCDLVGELQRIQSMKAIAISSFTLTEDVERFKEAGFLAVHPKPLMFEQFTSAISELTGMRV